MEKRAYYAILDNWYLTKYINIESNNIEVIMSNTKKLLMEIERWKDAKLEIRVREESIKRPHGLVIFTYDKEVADRVFTNGYYTTEITSPLNDSPIDSTTHQSLIIGTKSLANDNTVELEDSLSEAFAAAVRVEHSKESSQVELEEKLPDELFDDLEAIGLSTVENEAKPEDEGEQLPDDLFHDLAERGESTVESEVRSEDERGK